MKPSPGYGIGAIVLSLLILVLLFASCIAARGAGIDTTKAVIHHTSSPDWSVDRIRKIHMEERNWDDIGYHFLIRRDGTIEKGRGLDKKGAHALGRNHWVGIALTGYNEFTGAQINSLVSLLDRLGVKHIERHHEECPGTGLDIESIQEQIGG